ncbi:hypothetical protein [Bosea sp. 124]|uniref:hypothetical protein n=1 Tax=Bosea sp. 124 TaxID=2135642 RepID=UPI0011B28BF4|nr:hypothetical protein [Bosea sp. 124]
MPRDLGRDLGMKSLGFSPVLDAQGSNHFALADESAQNRRHGLAELLDVSLGVSARTRHQKNHLAHPVVSLGLGQAIDAR